MRRLTILTLFLVLQGPGNSIADDLAAHDIGKIDEIFAEFDHSWTPGCSVGVIRNSELVFRRGYGMANLEYGLAIDSQSVFRIGSTSKQFTAAAIGLLQMDGLLKLDDNVRKYLPELPVFDEPMTIRQFINHTSGIRDYLELMHLGGYREEDWATDEDVLKMIARQQSANFTPGSQFLYSNSGYFLLSIIVKRVSGKSLKQFAQERIFGPLNMNDTHFHDDTNHIVRHRASGYGRTESGGFRIFETTLGMVGDGGLYTTVDDLLMWDRNFYSPVVGDAAFVAEQQTVGMLNDGTALDYAMGLRVSTYRSLPTVRHGGAFVGYRAELLRFPGEETSIICLCNLAESTPSEYSDAVADILLADRFDGAVQEVEESLEVPEVAAESAETDEVEIPEAGFAYDPAILAGRYYSYELDVVYEISIDDSDVKLEVGNDLDGELTYVGDNTFDRNGVTLQFIIEDDTASEIKVSAGRAKNFLFDRIGDP